MIELVDFNLNLLGDKAAVKAKGTRRGRRGAGKKTGEAATATTGEVKAGKAAAKKEAEAVAPAAPAPVENTEEVTDAIEETGLAADAEEAPKDEPQAEEEETKA
jgi:hypothetical protein